VIASIARFRRCCTLMLIGFAVASLIAGCRSTNDTSNAGGAASSKPGSSWNLFAPGPEPKKIQTPSDFVGQPRPTI